MGLFEAACGVPVLASGLLGGYAAEALGGETPYLIVEALALVWAGVLARSTRSGGRLSCTRSTCPRLPGQTRQAISGYDAHACVRFQIARQLARSLLHLAAHGAHPRRQVGRLLRRGAKAAHRAVTALGPRAGG